MLTALFYTTSSILLAIAVAKLLIHEREPSSTLAWLLFVVFVPILGPLLFLIFGPQNLERRAVRRKWVLEQKLALTAAPHTGVTYQRRESDPTVFPLKDSHVMKLVQQISEYSVTAGNRVEILREPDMALARMHKAIAGAKRFVHLEYYIISSDDVTEQLFDSLAEAAARGVEVRILYDAFGSLSLKKIYFRKLRKHGVKTAGFLPLSFWPSRLNFNFRNHRKILVVDGAVSFTGGANLGRHYLGKFNEGQWRDFTVEVNGPVCRQLQDVFAKDWHFTTGEDLFDPKYYPAPDAYGNSVVQVLESGPDTLFRTLHQALFLALNDARKEILLTTPYFVPDGAVMSSLVVAALRGVTVRLLFPMKSDAPIVQWASRSFYESLLRAGVEIYEYEPRVLHSKMLVIDRKWTILGSANMDIRSFRLNFELNLLVYGEGVAGQATDLFEFDLERSKRICLEEFLSRPLRQQVLENACRLLSPLL